MMDLVRVAKDVPGARERIDVEIDRRVRGLAEYISVTRRNAKITQKDIEAATGLTSGNLSYIETGARVERVALKSIVKIAFALGLQPSQLVRLLDDSFADANVTLGGIVPVVSHTSISSELRENTVRQLEAISARGGKQRSKRSGSSAPPARSKKNR